MSKVFRLKTVKYFNPEGKQCTKAAAMTRNGKGELVLNAEAGFHEKKYSSSDWYGKISEGRGIHRRVRLCPSKKASQQLLDEMKAQAARNRYGLGDPYCKHRDRPVLEHIEDYLQVLVGKSASPAHIKQVRSRLNEICVACDFVCLDDLSSDSLTSFLNRKRADSAPGVPLPPNQEWFRLREVAALLDITPGAVRPLVLRHGLPATGQGKARRFPKATVRALLELSRRGISAKTSNDYVVHAKGFGRYLVQQRKMAFDPFAHVAKTRISDDRRHDRRALELTELQRLLDVTAASSRSFRGLSGPDRAMLYRVGASTGIRASALASLAPKDFDLDAEIPCIELPAKVNKNRKDGTHYIPPELVPALRLYFRGKPTNKRLWSGTWAKDHRGAEMIRKDLAEAGIPYVTEGTKGRRYADFHCLRHTFITLNGKSGVELLVAQKLAGHSNPLQTAKYSHRDNEDIRRALERFPSLQCQEPKLPETSAAPVCPQFVQTAWSSVESGGEKDVDEDGRVELQETAKPWNSLDLPKNSRVSVQRGRRGSNPQPPDRQNRPHRMLR